MKAFWDKAKNCVWCGEAGRCRCKHTVSATAATKAAQAIVDGLTIDGSHHKQYYLEEAARLLGADIKFMRKIHHYEEGMP